MSFSLERRGSYILTYQASWFLAHVQCTSIHPAFESILAALLNCFVVTGKVTAEVVGSKHQSWIVYM